MSAKEPRSLPLLLVESARVLGLTQEQMGNEFGSSRRTVARWAAGRARPVRTQIRSIACAVHGHDAQLALDLATHAGETLESLGLVQAPQAPSPPPRAMPALPLVVDSVVCAAAETLDTTPRTVREAVRAAFARARAMGLTIAEVDDALGGVGAK